MSIRSPRPAGPSHDTEAPRPSESPAPGRGPEDRIGGAGRPAPGPAAFRSVLGTLGRRTPLGASAALWPAL